MIWARAAVMNMSMNTLQRLVVVTSRIYVENSLETMSCTFNSAIFFPVQAKKDTLPGFYQCEGSSWGRP